MSLQLLPLSLLSLAYLAARPLHIRSLRRVPMSTFITAPTCQGHPRANPSRKRPSTMLLVHKSLSISPVPLQSLFLPVARAFRLRLPRKVIERYLHIARTIRHRARANWTAPSFLAAPIVRLNSILFLASILSTPCIVLHRLRIP